MGNDDLHEFNSHIPWYSGSGLYWKFCICRPWFSSYLLSTLRFFGMHQNDSKLGLIHQYSLAIATYKLVHEKLLHPKNYQFHSWPLPQLRLVLSYAATWKKLNWSCVEFLQCKQSQYPFEHVYHLKKCRNGTEKVRCENEHIVIRYHLGTLKYAATGRGN